MRCKVRWRQSLRLLAKSLIIKKRAISLAISVWNLSGAIDIGFLLFCLHPADFIPAVLNMLWNHIKNWVFAGLLIWAFWDYWNVIHFILVESMLSLVPVLPILNVWSYPEITDFILIKWIKTLFWQLSFQAQSWLSGILFFLLQNHHLVNMQIVLNLSLIHIWRCRRRG